MIPVSWSEMQCPITMQKEYRKVAKVQPDYIEYIEQVDNDAEEAQAMNDNPWVDSSWTQNSLLLFPIATSKNNASFFFVCNK